MPAVVAYTANIGGHDQEWPIVEQHGDVLFARVTEDDIPITGNDRLVARWAKCHPHLLFPEAQITVWYDACLEITDPHFIMDCALQTDEYGALPHPDRNSLDAELEAAEPMEKYTGNTHAAMLKALRRRTLKDPGPLLAMTVLCRRRTPAVVGVDTRVWYQTQEWSTSDCVVLDQLILPFALALEGVEPTLLRPPCGGSLWDNDWFVRREHRRET